MRYNMVVLGGILMRFLFIDTHSEVATISIIDGDEENTLSKRSERSHSEIVMPMIESVFKESKLTPQKIDEIIIVNGPGSFTGVRIGVVIAKTLAYTLNIPIKSITSLEAYGESADKEFDVVIVKDPKGMYSARKKDGKYIDFMYQKSNDFKKYVEDNKFSILDSEKLNIKKILKYLENKESMNPHLVNPIYIKEIDALK